MSDGPTRTAPRPRAARLVCTAGPKAGHAFALEGNEVVLGRATDATISIPDPSMSRRHAQLRRVGNGWVLRELAPGNRTRLNGELIKNDRPLRAGDVLTLGDTELTLVDASPSTPHRRSPRGRRPGADDTVTQPVGRGRSVGAEDETVAHPARLPTAVPGNDTVAKPIGLARARTIRAGEETVRDRAGLGRERTAGAGTETPVVPVALARVRTAGRGSDTPAVPVALARVRTAGDAPAVPVALARVRHAAACDDTVAEPVGLARVQTARARDATIAESVSRPAVASQRWRLGSAFVDRFQAEKHHRLLRVGAVSLAAVLVSSAAFGYRQYVQAEREDTLAAERERTQLQLAGLFQEGKNLVRAGKWDEAKVRFERIHQADPGFPGVQDYLAFAARELPNQHQLAVAAQALTEHRVAAAKSALDAVSPDTQQFEQLRKLKAALDQKVLERIEVAKTAAAAAGRLRSKRDAIAEHEKVSAIATDVLAAFPDHRDALVLKQAADARIAALSHVPTSRPAPPPKPWDAVTRQFVDGDLTGALATANACAAKGTSRCREQVSVMKQFREKYADLEELDERGLASLLALHDRITDGRPSKFSRLAGTHAANLFFKNASAAKAEGVWGRALEYAQQALRSDPGHAGARAIIRELQSKAREVYLQGYALKDSQPEDALQRFRDVLLLAPPTDEWHQKAKRWIAELSR